LEREKKQLKALLKSKDPSFSFLDIEVDEEDTEVIQVKVSPKRLFYKLRTTLTLKF
jgi:hypothetical protein